MPQLIALAAVGAGLYAGYRWLAKQVEAAAERSRVEVERAAKVAAAPRDLGKLEWDDEAGAYRPRS